MTNRIIPAIARSSCRALLTVERKFHGAMSCSRAFAASIAVVIIYASYLRSSPEELSKFQETLPGVLLIALGLLLLCHRFWHGMPFWIKVELKQRRFLKSAIDTSTRGAMLVFFGAQLLAYSRPIEELLTWVGPFMLPLFWFVYTCLRVFVCAVYLSLRKPDPETAVAFWLGLVVLILFVERPIVGHPLAHFP